MVIFVSRFNFLSSKILASLGALFLLSACASTVTRHPDFGTDCVDLDANVDCVRVFFGTNRAVTFENATVGPIIQTEVDITKVEGRNAESLNLGRADVWLPKLVSEGGQRELGETPLARGEAPQDKREQEQFVFVTRITASGKERFVQDLTDSMTREYGDSILLFVHGFNVQFESAIIRSAQLAVDLGEGFGFNPGAPVLFSWPSAGRLSLSSYFNDGDQAGSAAPYLSEFLDIMTADVQAKRINIVAHSMGNRVLTAALEDYAQDYLQKHPERDVEFRIVLAAADMERDVFDLVADNIVDLDPNVTIYASDDDLALNFSKLINGEPRLGDTDGNKPYIRQEDGYVTVDATPVATELFGLGHNYYSDDPFILNDIRCALADTPPVQRALDERNFNDQRDQPSFYFTDPEIEPDFRYCALSRQSYPATRAQLDEGLVPTPAPVAPAIAAPAPEESRRVDDGAFNRPTQSDRRVEALPQPDPAESVQLDGYVFSLFFETGIDELTAEQITDLVQRVDIANQAGVLKKVIVTGFADAQGDAASNLALSQRRAQNVANYLISEGINPDLIEIIANGETIAANTTTGRDGRADENDRRVDIQFIFE